MEEIVEAEFSKINDNTKPHIQEAHRILIRINSIISYPKHSQKIEGVTTPNSSIKNVERMVPFYFCNLTLSSTDISGCQRPMEKQYQ
jgi:hypothetical protein